ncbi:hypothetical protein D9M71_703000 [compost metagenome]
MTKPLLLQSLLQQRGGEIFNVRNAAKQVLQVICNLLLPAQRLVISADVMRFGSRQPGR